MLEDPPKLSGHLRRAQRHGVLLLLVGLTCLLGVVRAGGGQKARTGVALPSEGSVKSVEKDHLLDHLLQGQCDQSFIQITLEG